MILVIGAGVAGLSCALAAARAGAEVELVTCGVMSGTAGETRSLSGGNTALAQGGIAASVGASDTVGMHLEDTLRAGAGIVDAEAAEVLVRDGRSAVRRLIDDGFAADREATGDPALGLEAAHRRHRIVHAGGDRTGAVLHGHLLRRALLEGRIRLRDAHSLVSLVEDAGAVTGAMLQHGSGRTETVRAAAVVLATGGYAALYSRTSNEPGAQGTGIVQAARAGALVSDLEFVQFHPTVLAGAGTLVSEAVRGAGAFLRDGSGRRFMLAADPAAELAPRDVVSREIHRVLRERGEEVVWLDATGLERDGGPGTLARRFPAISAATREHGHDWTRDPVPVSPAAHYTMGGVLSDLDGRSSVPGLFVAGEAASTGVHGGNRLASNSLLEGLVFGRRAGLAAVRFAGSRERWEPRGAGFSSLARTAEQVRLPASLGRVAPKLAGLAAPAPAPIVAAVSAGLGVERDAEGLAAAGAVFVAHAGAAAALAGMVGAAATAREESRGSHQRSDFPDSDPAAARRRAFRAVFASEPSTRTPPCDAAAPVGFRAALRSGRTASEPRSFVSC